MKHYIGPLLASNQNQNNVVSFFEYLVMNKDTQNYFNRHRLIKNAIMQEHVMPAVLLQTEL